MIMSYLIVDRNERENMRNEMRESMRVGHHGDYKSGGYRTAGNVYHEGYREGYKHGWEDKEDDEDGMRRYRDSRGRYM